MIIERESEIACVGVALKTSRIGLAVDYHDIRTA